MKKLLAMYNFLRLSITVDGETQYVPSDLMLREVLPTLPNMAEQEELCLDSNYFVLSLLFDPPDEVVKKELEIWKNCCKSIGRSFEQHYRAGITMSWFASILDTKTISPRLERDAFHQYLDTFEKRLKDEPFYELQKKLQIDTPLTRFKEYRDACKIIDKVFNETEERAKTDNFLASQLRSWIQLKKKEAHERYLENNIVEVAMTQCLQCGRIFEYPLGRGRSKQSPHCDNDACKKQYERTKPSKLKRSSKSEWKSKGSKANCQYCKAVRMVNSDRICKTCFKNRLLWAIPKI
jgi:hypothetical protein